MYSLPVDKVNVKKNPSVDIVGVIE